MQTKQLFNQDGIEVTEQDFGYPIGIMYVVNDGVESLSFGELPELEVEALRELIREAVFSRVLDGDERDFAKIINNNKWL